MDVFLFIYIDSIVKMHLKESNIIQDMENSNWGGKRNGAGAKKKEVNKALSAKLDKHIEEDDVFIALNSLIKEKNLKAIQLWFNYKFGRPVEYKVTDMSIQSLDDIGAVIKWGKTEDNQ